MPYISLPFHESSTDLVKTLLAKGRISAVCAQRIHGFLLKSTSFTKFEPDLNDRRRNYLLSNLVRNAKDAPI